MIKKYIWSELKKIDYLSITTDNWSVHSVSNFMSLTAHYVDCNFNVVSRTLRLKYVNESKTSDVLHALLTESRILWKIDNKVGHNYLLP